MRQRSMWETILLAALVGVTRFLARSHALYDIDSVNFALGMERFDPSTHQPHPPGYFLYICLGRAVFWVCHDANLSLVILSIVASCAVVVLIYYMTMDWFGLQEARFAGGLYLFSPLACFHGTVALTYSVEAFFSTLLGYLCWGINRGRTSLTSLTGVVLGVSAGVRPSSLILLGPLFLFSIRNTDRRIRLRGVAALAGTLFAWFAPMIWAAGGLKRYLAALLSLWSLVPAKGTVFNSSPATSVARAFTVVFIFVLCFGAASVGCLGAFREGGRSDSEKRQFTLVWAGPALLFFTFIYLKFVNSGYLLLLIGPACIWLGFWITDWHKRSSLSLITKSAAFLVCGAINVAIFLDAPLYCSLRSVRRFEAELASLQVSLPQICSPGSTLVIGFDSHFLGYRHAGYYLPDFVTVEYPEVKLTEGTRAFTMHDRSTRLLSQLPVSPYTKFVIFPLPMRGNAYRDYVARVVGSLPGSSLHTMTVGGNIFVTGPLSDLPLLFPITASESTPDVYPQRH